MGTVYKVRLARINKILALKRLAPQPALVSLLGFQEIKRLFIAEARTMGGVRHPNIAAVWDFQDDLDHTFFTMEFYCRNLGDLIGETYDLEAPSRLIDLDLAIEVTRQTLKGLSRLHYAGIVHRDIKPFNLLLTDEGQVKIADFGLSKLRGETFRGSRRLHVGSPYYAAPEQERDPDSVGPAADLYSVGVMLFRMITGKLPLSGRAGLTAYEPLLSQDWDRFMDRSVTDRPERRFGSARDMLTALEVLEADWKEKSQNICRLDQEAWKKQLVAGMGGQPVIQSGLRRQGRKVSPRQAAATFGLDELGRPRRYYRHQFDKRTPDMITDRATALTWQAEGSEFPMTWPEGLEYIHHLNMVSWGGHDDWRLPTVDELLSLFNPPSRVGGSCLDPLFSHDRKVFWSLDQRSAVAAWYVSIDLGYVGWQDHSCQFHVRAVSSEGAS